MQRFSPPAIRAPLGDVTTDRLELRRFAAGHLDGLAAVFAHDEVWQFPHGGAFTREQTETFLRDQIAEWDECGFGCWAAVHREDERIIGYIGLCVPMFLPEILPAVEIGWRLDPGYWGQGLATEGAHAALREGFTTLGLEEITCILEEANARSGNVAERIGMRFDRIAFIPANDRRSATEVRLYRLTRSEWQSANEGTLRSGQQAP